MVDERTLRPEWLRSWIQRFNRRHAGTFDVQVDGATSRRPVDWCPNPLEIVPPMEEKIKLRLLPHTMPRGKPPYDSQHRQAAVGVFEALSKRKESNRLRLVIRGFAWERSTGGRIFCAGTPRWTHGRIVVTTQVVEAGVDISADCLMTELAPCPRGAELGRAARYAAS